ncbi:hypothetical protein AA313_de0208157 [Arthrobotrys entomopaga]|nr:hypothetical protein AA313_de0208157 [Arthrobotrys entomopaga]
MVSYNLTRPDLEFLKSHRYFHGVEYSEAPSTAYTLAIRDAHFPEPDFLFSTPIVVECFGAGFDKLDRADYWTLRWPRVQKIHKDREYLDAVTFQELQKMADGANTVSSGFAEEVKEWESKLRASTARRRKDQKHGSRSEEVKGMLAKSFWEADSPTVDELHAMTNSKWNSQRNSQKNSQWSEGKNSVSFVDEVSQSFSRREKRPLSQITGNCSFSQEREMPESQHDSRRTISTSPLFEGRVYLMQHLSDNPEIGELLNSLQVIRGGSCKDLFQDGHRTDIGVEEKAILLVEERKRDEIKEFIKQFGKNTPMRKTVVEIYSWRILKRMQKIVEDEGKDRAGKRRKVEDWTVMHLDTIP